ncbi:MAG: hypothetical protein H6706_30750 [Myxococcales bacterium]|nr:hypothetical protein [Myxococcales bacterium]
MSRRPRGHVLALFVLVLLALSALVMAVADGHLGREVAARSAFRGTAAEVLARGGLEAAVAALRGGRPVPARPLDEGGRRISVTVEQRRPQDAQVLACGEVEGARRCVRGTLLARPTWRVARAEVQP